MCIQSTFVKKHQSNSTFWWRSYSSQGSSLHLTTCQFMSVHHSHENNQNLQINISIVMRGAGGLGPLIFMSVCLYVLILLQSGPKKHNSATVTNLCNSFYFLLLMSLVMVNVMYVNVL